MFKVTPNLEKVTFVDSDTFEEWDYTEECRREKLGWFTVDHRVLRAAFKGRGIVPTPEMYEAAVVAIVKRGVN